MNEILISPKIAYPNASLMFNSHTYPAVIGRGGSIDFRYKKEGDCKTPIADDMRILGVYVRWDRLSEDEKSVITSCNIPFKIINQDDIWVDDINSDLYNMPAKIEEVIVGTSYEKLWRKDHLYDIFLDLDFNRVNIKTGLGSAIFIHLSRDQEAPANKPTAGCIALKRSDMLDIIKDINDQTTVRIV